MPGYALSKFLVQNIGQFGNADLLGPLGCKNFVEDLPK